MTVNTLVVLLASMALQAAPASHAIPLHLNPLPEAGNSKRVIPVKIKPDSFGVQTTAASSIVVDLGSGTVLYAHDAEVPRSIASITKLMTAMVLLDQGLNPDQELVIDDSDFAPIGRRYFGSGERLRREDAFRAMLVGSINEIASAFARMSPGGTESFVDAMNTKAKLLGLEHAEFHDTSGIDPRNVASATDVAKIFRSASAYPEIREVTESGTFHLEVLDKRTVKIDPTNNLLTSYLNKDPYKIMIGKTGSLPEAGFCLGTVTRHPKGQQVITIVLGSTNHFARFQEVKALTSWAFDAYEWK